MWFALLLAGTGSAGIPLPDYDDALARGEWYALNQQMDSTCRFNERVGGVECGRPEVLDQVIERGNTWQRSVQEDPGLCYLVGLAWRYKGNDKQARTEWERAVRLDPDYRAPWYDLGELYLAAGELEAADKAFGEVARLTRGGPEAWLAPWRLAEVAAYRKDSEAFETHLREAIRHGFTFDRVAGLANWRAFLADPVIGPSVEKLVTVYGGTGDLESIRAEPTP